MKIRNIILVASSVLFFAACEGCVKKAAKKTTDLGISAIEGVSESLAEHGEAAGEKVTDALGTLLKGAGKSIERQLEEHATHVATVAGRTFVQAIDGMESGVFTEYYSAIPHEDDFGSGIVLQYYGKIKDSPVLDAYFVVLEQGDYACKFEFVDANGKVLMTREATIEKRNTEKKLSVVSIGLNADEEKLFNSSAKTKITVAPKP